MWCVRHTSLDEGAGTGILHGIFVDDVNDGRHHVGVVLRVWQVGGVKQVCVCVCVCEDSQF